MSREQIDLLKRTVCREADDNQFALFMHVCNRHGLDPFAKQVYAVFYNNSESKAGRGPKDMVIITGIDGFRKMASRDHKDFAGTSSAEFTWFDPPRKTPAGRPIPETATIKVFRKGFPEPIKVSTRWDEYAPADLRDRRADFWNRMPTNQLEKCTEAKGLRKEFPGLGDVLIADEIAQRSETQTERGHDLTDEKGFNVHGTPVTAQARFQLGRERAAQVKDQKMEQLQRYFCPKHRCDILKCPSDEHTQAELDAMDKLDAERKQAAPATPAKTEAEKPPIEVKPANKPAESNGQTVEVDSSNPQSPIIRGDITNLLPIMQKYLTMTWGQDSWWHCLPKDIPTLREMCEQLGFRLMELAPKKFPATPMGGKEPPTKRAAGGESKRGTSTAEPTLVKGILIRCDAAMVRDGKVPTRQVKIDSVFYACYRNTLFPHLDKHIGQKIEAFIDKRKQVVGLKSLGPLTFDTDGATTCIDNATREAGGRTLWGNE